MTTSQNAGEKLKRAIEEAATMSEKLAASCLVELSRIAELCAMTLKNSGRLFFCGNGGSAAESQHLATEFVVRLSSHNDRQAFAAIALTTDTSLLTACSNDYGFEKVFSRQLESLMRKDDVLFLLSTSGKSPNLIEAAKTSRSLGGKNVALLGEAPTPLDPHLDFALRIPSPSGQRVQEAHLFLGHLLVELIEDAIPGKTLGTK